MCPEAVSPEMKICLLTPWRCNALGEAPKPKSATSVICDVWLYNFQGWQGSADIFNLLFPVLPDSAVDVCKHQGLPNVTS